MSTNASVSAETAVSGLTSDTSGRGRGRGGGGRGRGRGGRSHQRSSGRGVRTSTFKGATPEMNGNVFECFDEQTDRRQYAKTVEALDGYVKKNLKYSEDLTPLFLTQMTLPVLTKPPKPGAGADETDIIIWQEDVKDYSKRTRILRENLGAIQAVVWGQCSEAMQTKLKAISVHVEKAAEHDCAWFLKSIKAITMQFDDKRNGYYSLLDAMAGFLNCRQQQGQTVDRYLDSMNGWVDTIEHHGGSIVYNPRLAPAFKDDGTPYTDDEREAIARDRTLGVAMIRGADPTRYGTLIGELANSYNSGSNDYPTDINAAYSRLVMYSTPSNARARGSVTPANTTNQTTAETSAMTFTQRSAVPGTNGITHDGITCYNCQRMGHYSADCPDDRSIATTVGTTLTQYAYMLAQGTSAGINPNWILLDSQSTISVFRNPTMLTNIRPSTHVLRALTNGGHQDSMMVADFPNLGKVWFNAASIANILSLAEVRKVCRVTMDTETEPALCVHRLDGSVMKFIEHPCGLYVYDSGNTNASSTRVSQYTMVNTVANQRKLFTRREVAAADDARELYRKLGRPSEAEFQHLLRSNQIRNCPVTPGDASRALIIYGPDIATIKGKTVKGPASPRTPTFEAVPIPPPVLEHHRDITLCLDFFFVQGHAFFHTISRDINFRTVSPVADRTRATILQETRAAINLYVSRGFRVRDLHTDGEFACIRADMLPIVTNVVAADSHVGEVERSIRTIKERLRSCVHGLPFRRLPKLLSPTWSPTPYDA